MHQNRIIKTNIQPSTVSASQGLEPTAKLAILLELLGVRLTSFILLSKTLENLDAIQSQRLDILYQVVSKLLDVEAPATIRAWLIGCEPILNDTSVVEAIRENRFQAALNAADDFRRQG